MAGEAFFKPFYAPSSGDCPDCDADTELRADPDHPGIWHLQVQHDETCPTWQAIQRERRS